MILIEQLLSANEVTQLRARLSEVPWQSGGATAMGMAADVKQNAQADALDASVVDLANTVLVKCGTNPKLVSAVLPHKIFPPCFNRYAVGEAYGYHVDASIMRMPNSSDVLRSDMSMTLFLSDPSEYEGGELTIRTDFGESRVKPASGDAVVYPSSSLHQVTPVTSGVRLAAITWMQSLIPDSHVRETLFELDTSIQALSTNPAIERAELDRLHCVYHNLVRHHSRI